MGATRTITKALLAVALTGCSASQEAAMTDFKLTSSAFTDGQPIPVAYSCEGADQPPPLEWSDVPEGTKGFALVVDDPDAPSGTFRHWGAYNVPASARGMPAAAELAEVENDFGRTGYGGPCPPRGHGPHHYRFKLFALDTDALRLPAGANIGQLEAEAGRHALARAELTGTYERK